MPYTPVLTTLGFVVSSDRSRVLMVHRVGRSDDEQLGKWNGLGGKLERDEDVWSAMTRELREEAGIEVVSMRLRGTVSWPGFHRDGSDALGFIFLVDAWTAGAYYAYRCWGSNWEVDPDWRPRCDCDRLTRAVAGRTVAILGPLRRTQPLSR